MSNNPTGGPAFPTNEERFPDGEMRQEATYGMTLRDYFAAKAMQGILACPGSIRVNEDADFAYRIADAMLKARSE